MLKRFGASGINREMFEDCFEQPINMKNVSDSEMQNLADEAERTLVEVCGEKGEILIQLWGKEELTEEEESILAIECSDAWETFWDILYNLALAKGGVVVDIKNSDEDDDDDDDDDDEEDDDDDDDEEDDDEDCYKTKSNYNPIQAAVESFSADMNALRNNIDDILNTLPYDKILTMRLRSIDKKLADIDSEFSKMCPSIQIMHKMYKKASSIS